MHLSPVAYPLSVAQHANPRNNEAQALARGLAFAGACALWRLGLTGMLTSWNLQSQHRCCLAHGLQPQILSAHFLGG